MKYLALCILIVLLIINVSEAQSTVGKAHPKDSKYALIEIDQWEGIATIILETYAFFVLYFQMECDL